MRHSFLAFFAFTLLLASCTTQPDTLIGEWKADKVSVQFDENHATPEVVKQIGEMEKQNHFSINADSVLVFSNLDGEWRGRVTLNGQGDVYCDDQLFGRWANGQIITHTPSPLGEIVIIYRKK